MSYICAYQTESCYLGSQPVLVWTDLGLTMMYSNLCMAGIPEEKAGRIATAAIAAQLSKVLQDTYTSIRAGREDDVLMPLLRIDALLRALPLAPGSAEAAMVGESVASRATLQERQVSPPPPPPPPPPPRAATMAQKLYEVSLADSVLQHPCMYEIVSEAHTKPT